MPNSNQAKTCPAFQRSTAQLWASSQNRNRSATVSSVNGVVHNELRGDQLRLESRSRGGPCFIFSIKTTCQSKCYLVSTIEDKAALSVALNKILFFCIKKKMRVIFLFISTAFPRITEYLNEDAKFNKNQEERNIV